MKAGRKSLEIMVKSAEITQRRAINLPTGANTVDAHGANLISDFINYPVVAHADALVVFAASKFAGTHGRRLFEWLR